ncbi:hypothetical protein DSCOOX_04710 [Desulfosarcina ovata subsp. ovata]|uniref:PAC domain-containing protein n=1 Tax=Desulfosarcina ovata subsp. ovata TaxID=2752305 RepID=A0A5K8A481_9BACT|nr:hypothetical protein DSCOOX_04710 [Desulfosarcina ovata subsp. ovata]
MWVRAYITADRDEGEAVVQWRMVLMDISREKEAEKKLQKLNESLEHPVRRASSAWAAELITTWAVRLS